MAKTRAPKRSSYEAYEAWYEKRTKELKERIKGTNKWAAKDTTIYYDKKYSEEEYYRQAAKAKRKGIKTNIARTIAESQELVNKKFRHQYEKRYGTELGDIRDTEAREQIFLDFFAEESEKGLSHDEIEAKFKEYYY